MRSQTRTHVGHEQGPLQAGRCANREMGGPRWLELLEPAVHVLGVSNWTRNYGCPWIGGAKCGSNGVDVVGVCERAWQNDGCVWAVLWKYGEQRAVEPM